MIANRHHKRYLNVLPIMAKIFLCNFGGRYVYVHCAVSIQRCLINIGIPIKPIRCNNRNMYAWNDSHYIETGPLLSCRCHHIGNELSSRHNGSNGLAGISLCTHSYVHRDDEPSQLIYTPPVSCQAWSTSIDLDQSSLLPVPAWLLQGPPGFEWSCWASSQGCPGLCTNDQRPSRPGQYHLSC